MSWNVDANPTFASFPAPFLKSIMPMLAAEAESGHSSSPSSPVVFLCMKNSELCSRGCSALPDAQMLCLRAQKP